MRISNKKINNSLQNELERTFIQLLSDLNEEKQMKQFINDFFTPSELSTFTKRLAIAYWLKKGRSYQNIKQNLKVSSATISTVAEQSKTKGFQNALKLIEADEWANQWSEKIKKFVGK